MKQIKKMLSTYKKKTIGLTELEMMIKPFVHTYEDFAQTILQLEQDAILEMVKAKGRTNRTPSLAFQYRINKSELTGDYHKELQHYRGLLHPSINLDEYYRLDPFVWKNDLPFLLKMDQYLRQFSIPEERVPAPERSYELVGDEKWIIEKGGKEILDRIGLFSLLKIIPVSEPLMFGINPIKLQEKTQYHLIVENKTSYQGLLPVLKDTIFSTLIYGAGKAVVKSIEQFPMQYPIEANHQFFYFGDLDREGILIWHSFNNKQIATLALPFYMKCLEKEPAIGKEYQKEHHIALDNFLSFFPKEEQRAQIRTMLAEGKYHPQETLKNKRIATDLEGSGLDQLDIKEITSAYSERMRRLALFDPLYELDRKREQDQTEKTIDMKGLGLLTLLFFFEQKLMRQYRTGAKELAFFLRSLTESQYLLEQEDYERIARTIIQTFRPTTGRKRSYSFFDWDENRDGIIEYSILKANNFDLKTNTQYYTLDEDGLELVFATKEFYSEFQLSINQLMLRKQLDKGEFKGALRQINEMRIDVETLEERMIKLKHEIQRSIVSEETFERYKLLLEDIYSRLTREDEEFKELRQFVKETRDRLYSMDIHKKEQKTYEIILVITRELESVHYNHSRLLEQTFALKNTTLVTAQESLYYTGIQAFNFDQDLVSKIISTPLPLEAMAGVLHPLLKVEEDQFWSPLTVLAEQNITEERQERVEQGFIDAEDDNADDPYRNRLMKKYKELMEAFLEAYESGQSNLLTKFMDYLDQTGRSALLGQRYFYDFWLILHQRSPIIKGEVNEEDGKTLLGEALALLGNRTLTVQEGKEIVNRVMRFSIQELIITLEGEDDELF